jgi:hypothetical protein
MEAIVIFLLLTVVLGVLAGRLGFDSRPGPSSLEEACSQFGLTWGESESTLSEPRKTPWSAAHNRPTVKLWSRHPSGAVWQKQGWLAR